MKGLKVVTMLNDISKTLLKKMESANYSDDGIATVSLEEFTNVDEAKAAVLEIEKLPDYSEHKLDLNEGTMNLSVYNPKEDINGFVTRHPNRTACGGK